MFAGDAGRTDTRGGDTLRTLVNPKTGSSAVPTGQLPFYFIFLFYSPVYFTSPPFPPSFRLFPRASLSLPCSFRGDRSPCSLCPDYYSRPRCFTVRGWVSGDGGSVSSFTRSSVRFPSLRSTQEGLLERRENIVPPCLFPTRGR